jgi:hypothetical protein
MTARLQFDLIIYHGAAEIISRVRRKKYLEGENS